MKKVGIKIKMPHLSGSGFKIIIFLASQQKDLGSVEGRQDFVQSLNMDFAVAICNRRPILRKDSRVVHLQEDKTKRNQSK